MTAQTLDRPEDIASRSAVAGTTSSAHRHLGLLVAIGTVVSAALYLHGAGWWYAPLALVLAHGLLLIAVLFVTSRFAVGKAEGTAAAPGSVVIRRPRLYDRIVGLVTLGREGRVRSRVLELAEITPGSEVLDVGCGTGTLLLAAAERVRPSGELHGIDPAPEMIAHARAKAAAQGAELRLREGSADVLPYPDASFDVVLCTMVMHHLPETLRQRAVEEMTRVLRPGGRVVIVDLQRPRGLKAIFSLVALLHGLRTASGLLPGAHAALENAGLTELRYAPVGVAALGAVVGRRRS